jgi:hypothetical protein
MTQVISLGLLALTTAGGAAIGYGVRARQERLGPGESLLRLGRRDKSVQVLETKPATKVIPQNPRPETERSWESD